MEVVITADSTCDLPGYIIKENGINIFPLSILLGVNSYLDGIEIHAPDIYEYVKKTGELPKTSAVTPTQYEKVFSEITSRGAAVVHIGLSSAISSSFQNASAVAANYENVYCVDSKSLCTAMGLLVLKACDLRNSGFDAIQIAARIKSLVSKVHTTFVLDTLEYLHKGGRCSGIARFGANVLSLKPSISVSTETGKLDVAKKYRGKIESVYRHYISDCMDGAKNADKSRLVVANSGNVNGEIIEYARNAALKNGFKEVITATAGCTISSHCGPGTLAIFYMDE